MKKEDIQPWDWPRILFGEAPPEFLVEVLVRTTIVYIALLIVVRLMGKRMGGQLSISEMAVMVTLGAIVSPPMQIPQLGVLMGITILVCALIFQRGLNFAEVSSGKFEELSQGKTALIVKDGIIQKEGMTQAKLSRQQLYSVLRNKHLYNLGDVGRVYMEACGIFSVYKTDNPLPGLSIFPPSDESISAFSQEILDDKLACSTCGNVAHNSDESQACKVCGENTWIPATITVQSQLID